MFGSMLDMLRSSSEVLADHLRHGPADDRLVSGEEGVDNIDTSFVNTDEDIKPNVESSLPQPTIRVKQPKPYQTDHVPPNVHDFFETVFEQSPNPTPAQVKLLARYFEISNKKVKSWFAKRRSYVLEKEKEKIRGRMLRSLRPTRQEMRQKSSLVSTSDSSCVSQGDDPEDKYRTIVPFAKTSSNHDSLMQDWASDFNSQDEVYESNPIQCSSGQYTPSNAHRTMTNTELPTQQDGTGNVYLSTKPQNLLNEPLESFVNNISMPDVGRYCESLNYRYDAECNERQEPEDNIHHNTGSGASGSFMDAQGNHYFKDKGSFFERVDQASTVHWGVSTTRYEPYTQVALSPTWEPIARILSHPECNSQNDVNWTDTANPTDPHLHNEYNRCFEHGITFEDGEIYVPDIIDPATGTSQLFFSPPSADIHNKSNLHDYGSSDCFTGINQSHNTMTDSDSQSLLYYEGANGQISSLSELLDIKPTPTNSDGRNLSSYHASTHLPGADCVQSFPSAHPPLTGLVRNASLFENEVPETFAIRTESRFVDANARDVGSVQSGMSYENAQLSEPEPMRIEHQYRHHGVPMQMPTGMTGSMPVFGMDPYQAYLAQPCASRLPTYGGDLLDDLSAFTNDDRGEISTEPSGDGDCYDSDEGSYGSLDSAPDVEDMEVGNENVFY